MPADCLLLYCRAGFEKECAAEITDRAAALGLAGYCRTKPDTAFVAFHPTPGDPNDLYRRLTLADLTFARQMFPALRVDGLPADDPLMALMEASGDEPVAELMIEGADTNDGKALSSALGRLARAAEAWLKAHGRWWPRKGALPRLHLFFVSNTAAYAGLADRARSAPWPMGVQRLRMPPGTPSRSTLKLEEALLRFLTPAEQEDRLRPGLHAVDLGAAPGGWTWQFVRRSIRVIAVDNGPMDPRLLDSGIVEHRREDGFAFRPAKPVEWMVCDMVEQPARVAGLVARWAAEGWCREAIFNLKLPMKRRYEELQRCRGIIEGALGGRVFQLRFKQLYHDREEVTGHLWVRGD